MKLLPLLSVLLLFTACGSSNDSESAPVPPIAVAVDQKLESYLERFVLYSETALGRKIPIREVSLQFSDLGFTVEKGGINGRCTRALNGPSLVEIDRLFWEVADESRRENLIFHEFGHCLLNRNHLDEVDRSGVPKSIMYSYTLSSWLYSSRRNYYITELFQNSEFYTSPANPTTSSSSSFVDPVKGLSSCSTSL